MGTSIIPVPWKSINGTRGISKAVTLDGTYRSVNTKIIEGLKYRCDENGLVQSMGEVESGDRMKIERGPFADFICNVDELSEGRRAWVLIELLQQKTRAEISLDNLSKLS